jgi:phage gp36-like protein
MGYISNSEIEARLGSAAYVQLTDDAGSGFANETVVDEARAGAEGEVDAYLARRFAVPLDLVQHPEASGLIKGLALDLAEHRLRLRRPPVSAAADSRRVNAVALLQRLASGEVDLSARTAPASAASISQAIGDRRLLDRDALDEF